jgi:glycine cleavage system transcriptional repressor
MNNWFMLTLVGKDRPGIVAQVTAALFEGQCNLGEASMVRLGGNFTIMLMVQSDGTTADLERLVQPISNSLKLKHHVDEIEGELLHHLTPDAQITLYGADRAGIVAEVTGHLAEQGFNILNLESDVGGTADQPIYIMTIEGVASQGIEPLETTLSSLAREKGLEIHVESIDTIIG